MHADSGTYDMLLQCLLEVMITLFMLMQSIDVDEGEFNIMEVAENTIVDGRCKFGELLDHFAEDLCFRRSALGYASPSGSKGNAIDPSRVCQSVKLM